MDLHLRQLEAFVRVYRSGGVTSAARSMHMTQPAVTVLLRKFERACDVQLFYRRNRAVRPTPAADALIVRAEAVLAHAATFDSHLAELRRAKASQVEIAVTPSLGIVVMPSVLAKFERQRPGVKVHVHDVLPDQAPPFVIAGEVEFALGTFATRTDVEMVPVLEYSLVVLCRRDAPLARRRRITWHDVNQFPVVTLNHGYAMRTWIDETFARAGESFAAAVEVTQLTAAIAMVQENIGCSIVPSYLGMNYDALDIVALRVDELANTRWLIMMKREDTELSPAAVALLALIRDDLGLRMKSRTTPVTWGGQAIH
jgi:LysR family transcriptional regulator, carnitine catabolism transcriptional activator